MQNPPFKKIINIELGGIRMKFYVKQSSTLYKFIPKTGRTDFNTLKFVFSRLEKGDYMLDDKGNIYKILDPGQLHTGFLEGYRTIQVKEVDFAQLPDKIQNAVYYLATSYPGSTICKKVLEVAQQG